MSIWYLFHMQPKKMWHRSFTCASQITHMLRTSSTCISHGCHSPFTLLSLLIRCSHMSSNSCVKIEKGFHIGSHSIKIYYTTISHICSHDFCVTLHVFWQIFNTYLTADFKLHKCLQCSTITLHVCHSYSRCISAHMHSWTESEIDFPIGIIPSHLFASDNTNRQLIICSRSWICPENRLTSWYPCCNHQSGHECVWLNAWP